MKKLSFSLAVLVAAFAIFMLIFPNECRTGAIEGLLLCGKVVIPTLFPFIFCVIFISNSGIFDRFIFLQSITIILFGLTAKEFSIMLLSLIGGYPTGAKLIDQYKKEVSIPDKKANTMLCFCTNGGPAFIITAVGAGILGSKNIGWLLLFAHITASVTIAFLHRKISKQSLMPTKSITSSISVADNLVNSAAESASAVFSVCCYVILFSVIRVFFEYISEFLPFIKHITPLLEITTAVSYSKNLYHIAFLLGFSGLCICCQVAGLIKNFKLSFSHFITARVLHGLLSMLILYILLKVFKVSIPTISNNVPFSFAVSYKDITLTVSLFMLGILFIISTFNKNAGKSKKNMI